MDGPRLRSFIGVFSPRAVLGVAAELLDGLGDPGDALVQTFSSVEIVAAKPGAFDRLRLAGVDAVRWVDVGPYVAVECRFHCGPHVDAECVSSHAETVRHVSFAVDDLTFETAIHARLVRRRCRCGSNDPRLELAEPHLLTADRRPGNPDGVTRHR